MSEKLKRQRLLRSGQILVQVAALGACGGGEKSSPPNQPPRVSGDLTIALESDGSHLLTTADLSAVDPDVGDGAGSLIWRVIAAPKEGVLGFASDPDKVITSFTQAELVAGMILYTHTGGDAVMDQFHLQVEDDEAARSAVNVVSVTINQIDRPPTELSFLDQLETLLTTSDTSVRIQVASIMVTDADGGPSQLVLTGEDAHLFMLDEGVGGVTLYLRAGVSLDAIPDGVLNVTVQVEGDGPALELNLRLQGSDPDPGSGSGRELSDASADTGTIYDLAVGGSFLGSLQSSADEDWVRIMLEPGDFVAMTLEADASTLDPVLALRDAQGNPFSFNDDATFQDIGLRPLLEQRSSRILFSPQTEGPYYLSVHPYDETTSGAYRLTLDRVSTSEVAISTIDYAGDNPWIASLNGGGFWRTSGAEPVELYYAVRSGTYTDLFSPSYVAPAWQTAELAALDMAMSAWESIANISLTRTEDHEAADLWYWLSDAEGTDGALGIHQFPDPGLVAPPLNGWFNQEESSWHQAGLQAGGYAYLTILHEIGHGLGLDHPHNQFEPFPGVQDPFHDYGDHGLNQGIYTVMTYNDGWPTEYQDYRALPFDDYGFSRTPMALDIATIQGMYGANNNYRTGDDSYSLPVANGPETWWECIWDTGGVDTISIEGSLSCVIDLREAELTGPAAGGYVSYSPGIRGGFTIANGVVIENALGGSGNDMLIGNSADNRLTGGGGADRFVFGDDFGQDRIADFDLDRDFLVFQDFTEVQNFAAFYAASRQDGKDTVYDFAGDGENVLTLAETELDSLTATSLVFESMA